MKLVSFTDEYYAHVVQTYKYATPTIYSGYAKGKLNFVFMSEIDNLPGTGVFMNSYNGKVFMDVMSNYEVNYR